MLSSHEKCPVCGKEMRHIKYLNKKCGVLNNQAVSFVESVCSDVIFAKDMKKVEDYPYHQFFQVTSLYGDLYFQKVQFPDKNQEININYYTKKSEMIWYGSWKTDPVTGEDVTTEPITASIDAIIELDYPFLERTIRRFKSLLIFT